MGARLFLVSALMSSASRVLNSLSRPMGKVAHGKVFQCFLPRRCIRSRFVRVETYHSHASASVFIEGSLSGLPRTLVDRAASGPCSGGGHRSTTNHPHPPAG